MVEALCDRCSSSVHADEFKRNYTMRKGEYFRLDLRCDDCDDIIGWMSIEFGTSKFQLHGPVHTPDGISEIRAQNDDIIFKNVDIPTSYFDVHCYVEDDRVGWIRTEFSPLTITAHEQCTLTT